MRTTLGSLRRSLAFAFTALATLAVAPALAQAPASQGPATTLVALMTAQKLDAAAARHPSREGAFVGALYFPGQLLVVWAEYSAPQLLEEKLAKGDYRTVYIDLNSASDPATKTLVTDMGGNGLHPRRGGDDPFDMQDMAARGIRFDGRWGDQQLSEAEYMKIYAESDRAYAEALGALVAQLQGR